MAYDELLRGEELAVMVKTLEFTWYVKSLNIKSMAMIKSSENEISIGIKSKPIQGQANKEIIKKLAKHFRVSTSHIQIKSGHKSSQKIIEVL